jgi:cytochrome c-type biogenesis protein CcmF
MTVAPLLGALFLMLPFGPMLSWRVGDIAASAKKLAPAALLALATMIITLVLSQWRAIPAIGLALGVWLIAGGLIYLWTRCSGARGGCCASLRCCPWPYGP